MVCAAGKATRVPREQKGPLHLSANVQLMGRGPWLPFGTISDDELASTPSLTQ